jgi:hypothetical protein
MESIYTISLENSTCCSANTNSQWSYSHFYLFIFGFLWSLDILLVVIISRCLLRCRNILIQTDVTISSGTVVHWGISCSWFNASLISHVLITITDGIAFIDSEIILSSIFKAPWDMEFHSCFHRSSLAASDIFL